METRFIVILNVKLFYHLQFIYNVYKLSLICDNIDKDMVNISLNSEEISLL